MQRVTRGLSVQAPRLAGSASSQLESADRLGCAVVADRSDLDEAPRLAVTTKASRTENLPPGDTVRWSPQRKALVVAAIQDNVITFEEACQRYQLSAEELLSWQQAKQAYGIGGLRVTRFQYYREVPHTKKR